MSWDPATTAVVVNPAAANGSVGRALPAHEQAIRAALGAVQIYPTKGGVGGMLCAKEALQNGAKTILSMGGDGTHNEVINGIAQAGALHQGIRLGILPAGTGGDFKRLLIAHDLPGMLAALPGAKATPLDLGHTTFKADDGSTGERWFVNIANFGVGGLVDRKVNSSSKRFGGTVSFYIGTLKALAEYKPATVRLTVDGEVKGEFRITNMAVCNGRFAGGGMMFAPMARLGDGMFEIIVLSDGPLWRTIGMTATIYRGKHLSSPLVSTFRGKLIEAVTVNENPAWLDLDGEAPGVLPLKVRMESGALEILGAREELA
jgi:YegS/Rv2252/BmrU family lipid kinase